MSGTTKRRLDHVWDTLILVAAVLPLLLTSHLPLADLPNHLASQSIVNGWHDNASLREYYVAHFAITPNMAFELFSALMLPVLAIETVARIFCVATFSLIFLGVRSVNLALGGGGLRAYRFTPFLLYAGPFQFGFMNYWFSVGAGLLAFGAWLQWRRQPAVIVVPLFLMVSTLVLTCHLAGFGLFAMAVTAAELTSALDAAGPRAWNARFGLALIGGLARRAVRAAAVLLPPLVLFWLLSTSDADRSGVVWSTLAWKAEAVAAITLFSSPGIELLLLMLALVGAGLALLSQAVRLHRIGWQMAALMILAFLAAPRSLNGTGWIDYRIPSGAALFCLGCVVPGRSVRWRAPVAAGLGTLALLRVATIGVLWAQWEPTLAGIDEGFQLLPPGARLAVIEGRGSTSLSRQPPLWNIGGLAVVRRQVFDPYLFASIGSMVRYQPAWERFYSFDVPERIDRLDPVFDYLLVINPGSAGLPQGIDRRALASGPKYALYRVMTGSP